MDALVEIIGWAGAALVLTAYLLIAMRKLSSDSYAYHGMNIAGSILLAAYALWKNASASVAVNIVWLAIGLVAVASLYKRRKKA